MSCECSNGKRHVLMVLNTPFSILTVDTRITAYSNRLYKWRIYSMEWPYIQLRNHSASPRHCYMRHEVHPLRCLSGVFRQEWCDQILRTEHEQFDCLARLIIKRSHSWNQLQPGWPKICDRKWWLECTDMVFCWEPGGECFDWWVPATIATRLSQMFMQVMDGTSSVLNGILPKASWCPAVRTIKSSSGTLGQGLRFQHCK